MNSTDILQTSDFISISIRSLVKEIAPIHIPLGRRQQLDELEYSLKVQQVRSMAGKLRYIGIACSPLAAFDASYVQQCLPQLTVSGIKVINGVLRDTTRRQHKIQYPQSTAEEKKNKHLLVFSDTGYPHPSRKSVAQEGCIVGVAFEVKAGSKFHTLTWFSRKERRVSKSSASAETIAAVTSIGCAMSVSKAYKNATGVCLPITLAIDSRGLHRSLATHSQSRDRSVVAEVHRLRLHHKDGDIDRIVWIPGNENPADALTKPLTGPTTAILELMLVEGNLVHDVDDLHGYGIAKIEKM